MERDTHGTSRVAANHTRAFGRLVAILPEQADDFDTEIARYWVRISLPPLRQVLLRHLRVAGFPPSSAQLASSSHAMTGRFGTSPST